MTAGGLALMIPGVGPGLFAASVIVSFALEQAGSSKQAEIPSPVLELEKLLVKFMKEQRENTTGAFLHTINEMVILRSDLFQSVEWGLHDTMKEVHDSLNTHCFNAGNDTFGQQIDIFKENWEWGSNHNLTNIVALMIYGVQCMELKAILSANMGTACTNHANRLQDNDPGKGTWRDTGIMHHKSFLQDIAYISKFINSRVVDFNEWIVNKQAERLKSLRDVTHSTPGRNGGTFETVYEQWGFRDSFSKREFYAKAVQFEINQSCDFSDVDKKMIAYLKNMHEYYERALNNHIDHHFDILKSAIESWKIVKKYLEEWHGRWSSGADEIDGVAMYLRMVRATKT